MQPKRLLMADGVFSSSDFVRHFAIGYIACGMASQSAEFLSKLSGALG
jgi:hypothetical protein